MLHRPTSPGPVGQPLFVVVMGVSGSGKTTVGRALAGRLGCAFYDADDYHPAANLAKMAAGTPLTDADRAGWLSALAALTGASLARGESGVLACSALREQYRDVLRVEPAGVVFVYLKGDYATLQARMESREGHYMKAPMLRSQFETLEEPADALTMDAGQAPTAIVDHVMAWLAARSSLLSGTEPGKQS